MHNLIRFAAWFKTYGLVFVVSIYTALFLLCCLLVYRVVDEVLSVAQRGYFISVPAFKLNPGKAERELRQFQEMRKRLQDE